MSQTMRTIYFLLWNVAIKSEPRVVPNPITLLSVGRSVDENFITNVIKPHRGEVRSSVRTHHRESNGDRAVQQVPVDRVEIRETVGRFSLSDRELTFLQAVGDVLEVGDNELTGHDALS